MESREPQSVIVSATGDVVRAKKQNSNTQRVSIRSLVLLLALGTVSCGGGGSKSLPTTIPQTTLPQLTLVQVECKVLSWSDLIAGGPDEGPWVKITYQYWSDGSVTQERSETTTYRQSCP